MTTPEALMIGIVLAVIGYQAWKIVKAGRP